MEQYISKSALVADINSLRRPVFTNFDEGVNATVQTLLETLDTLEVKEVDLDDYYHKFLDKEWFNSTHVRTMSEMMAFTAKHFFELGIKTKQESNDEVKIGETQIYLEDDGGEPPYEGKQWLDLSCVEYEIPKTLFKDGDNVEIFIRKAQKGE